MKQSSGQSEIGCHPSWAVSTDQVVPRLVVLAQLRGLHRGGAWNRALRFGKLSRWRVGGAWVSTAGRGTEETRGWEKGNAVS